MSKIVNLIFQSKGKKAKGGKGKKENAKEKEEEEVVEEIPVEPPKTEDTKQLEILEQMENGGPIEDIDLTTEDWVNVQPPDIPKRYDALRKYVIFCLIKLMNLAYFFFVSLIMIGKC